MTRHCEEIYSRLAARGHVVRAYCRRPTPPEPPLSPGASYAGLHLQPLRLPRRRGLERLAYGVRASWHAARSDVDVVHYHSFASCLFCFLPRWRAKSVVVTVHRLEWQDEKWGRASRALLKLSERSAARFAHALISVSKTMADDLRRRYPRAAPITTIANGVTVLEGADLGVVEALGLEPKRFVLSVGRIVPEKALHVAIAALADRTRGGAPLPLTLVIAGGVRHEHAYLAELESAAARAGSPVRFLGAFAEGQPLAVLEAMGAGLCVVASDIAPHRELLEGRGVLFPVGDAVALGHELAALAADPARAEALGRAGRDHVVHSPEHRWDRAADETERVLAALVGSG
jgi:glycosyltransferase involved in cell wall biosynthesis